MKTEQFRGERWLADPHKLGLEYAAETNNVWARSGGLHPMRFGLKENSQSGDWSYVKSAYKFNGRLIGSTVESVDFVEHPNEDAFDRLYFVDPGSDPNDPNQGLIKFYEGDSIPSGQVLDMSGAHRLGVIGPEFRADGQSYSPPTLFFSYDVNSLTGRDVFITHLIYTLVNKWGQESPPSPPTSDFKYRRSNSTVELRYQGNLTGDPNIIGIRVYMAINGSYFRVSNNRFYGEATYDQGGYLVENLTDLTVLKPNGLYQTSPLVISDAPNEELVSMSWDRAPQGIKHLVMLDNQVMVCARKGEIIMSVPGFIHAFPADTIHRRKIAGEIKGLMKVSGGFVAITDTRAHLFLGVSAETMTEVNIDFPYPLGDKRSLIGLDGSAVWVTHEGIAVLGRNGGQIITSGWTERDVWSQYIDWKNCQCKVHEQRLILFCRRPPVDQPKGYVFDFRLQEVTSFDCSQATLDGLVYSDPDSGEIWFSHDSSGLNRFNRGSYMIAKWRSGRIGLPQGYIPAAGRVQSDNGQESKTLRVDVGLGADVDGSRLQDVPDDKPFWTGLPILARWLQFQVECNFPVSHAEFEQDIEDV